jgi:N-acylneuraminate cytidylyltransferase
MNNICIIPARAKSKRIKNKNIKKFFGKPIIYWAIQAALKSKCFSKIIVSSDSEKILRISKQYGAEQNELRPKELSKDTISMDEVIKYEILKENKKRKIDNICCIVATSPLINPKDIRKSLKILKENKTNYVFSASTYDAPIQRYFFLDKKGYLKKRKMNNLKKGSQDLKKAYHDAAQFYWASFETFSSKIHIYNGKSIPYYIPSFKSVDINDKDDWKKAEAMFKILKKF